MDMNSLDPRVNRLPSAPYPVPTEPTALLDQFGTFEVFVQPKEEKPFQHEGIVHAPNLEMAYVLAKEAFTRRFVCVSLYVVDTANVAVSPITEGDVNIYQRIEDRSDQPGEKLSYEIYHLTRRGKQHVHTGTVQAVNAQDAMVKAKHQYNSGKGICSVWVIRTKDIRFTLPEEKDLWNTLPEKKFRDASAYKGGDKLSVFLQSKQSALDHSGHSDNTDQ
jgi:ring-1,2-phenylacetyl-CoA epoxidase subunit PaaB